MNKELHIWLITPDTECYTDYISTIEALHKGEDIINTTLTHFISFRYKRRIFIHTNKAEMHEITIGDCDGTNRQIREGYNIEKLLYSGEFNWF